MYNLVIVESPTKAKTLSRFLDSSFRIESSFGHIRDLPQSKLGVDVENNFEPLYEIVPKKKKRVSELKAALSGAKNIFLATDPDREGEAIAWHLLYALKPKKDQEIKRIVFHEITESALKEALTHPRGIDNNLVDAQQARRVLDRLVGYKLSPLLWRKVRRGLSAGRVQSVAVRLIVDREREIQNFKSVEFWSILGEFQKDKDTVFIAKLAQKDGQKIEINNQTEANNITADLEKRSYSVSDVVEKQISKSPFPPFTTSTIQQAASNLLGWAAKRTMGRAQELYEMGYISYMRTDSLNLAQSAVEQTRDLIKKEFGDSYLPPSPKFYKTKSKLAQEAHEAIRPTNSNRHPDDIKSELNTDQYRLYSLIWKRMVACQMTDALYLQRTIDVTGGPYLFRASGQQMVFDGWRKIFERQNSEENGEEEDKVLPQLQKNDTLSLLRLIPEQKFTEPPARFTEATLIKTLEEEGIGRPSTYAPIITTVQERQYVEKVERKFHPTALGIAVNDFLVKNFPDLFEISFTAKMEDSLDEIASGEKAWKPVIKEFYEPFEVKLTKVSEKAKRVAVPVEKTDEKCEKCGGDMVIRIGRFGKFLACSNFPKCKNTKTYVEKTDLLCPSCGGTIIIKKTKRGRVFYGCSNYPKCNFASWTKPGSDQKPENPQTPELK